MKLRNIAITLGLCTITYVGFSFLKVHKNLLIGSSAVGVGVGVGVGLIITLRKKDAKNKHESSQDSYELRNRCCCCY